MEVFKKHVFVCTVGPTCAEEGGAAVCDALRKQIFDRGLNHEIRINKAGCLAQCGNGPMIVVYPEAVWYAHVKPEDCTEIIESHLIGDKPVERLLYDGKGRIV